MTEAKKPSEPYLVVCGKTSESYASMAEAREAAVNMSSAAEGGAVHIYQLRASVQMEWKPTWNELRTGE